MALTGQLSDLSLAELIEFFCNQRKTGRLKVVYSKAPGYFYIQAGSLVDAKLGTLSGVEAVYYALTQPNASFKFSPAFEAPRRTINQPWTQVVLEGLRRMDEGVVPANPFPENRLAVADDEEALDEITESEVENLEAFKAARAAGETASPLSMTVSSAAGRGRSKAVFVGASVLAVMLSVAAIGVPAGWYGRKAPAAPEQVSQPQASEAAQQSSLNSVDASAPQAEASQPSQQSAVEASAPDNEAILAARREREARERARLLRIAEERASETAAKPLDGKQPAEAGPNAAAPKKPEATKPAPKSVTVQVAYDESGRVTQASGADATAVRIARQKRFPAGKAGSATITIPIN